MLKREDYNYDYYNGIHPAGYTEYNEATYGENHFKKLAELYKSFTSSGKVLILGCAYGFTVKYLREMRINAYGIDFSQYALDQIEKDYKEYCWLEDVRNYLIIKNTKRKLNMSLDEKFDLIIDEDMFCCLTDEESDKVITRIKDQSNKIIHITTDNLKLKVHYNYHSVEECNSKSLENEIWLNRNKLFE